MWVIGAIIFVTFGGTLLWVAGCTALVIREMMRRTFRESHREFDK